MIPAIRGTHDILPGEVEKWQHVERVARALCERYGYVELRTPVIEREELFAKGTGETTDIVQKEMYSFTDKGGERVTLRPEATPSMVRAYVEHSLEHALPAAEALHDGADVPVRAAAEGPLPAVPSARRRGVRHERSGGRRGSHRPGLEPDRRRSAFAQAELVINSVGCAELPAAVSGGAARGARRRPAEALSGLPAAGEDESAAHLRLQGAGRPADHRSAAALGRLPLRAVRDALRRRCSAHLDDVGHSVADVAPAGPRARLLHAHDVRDPRADARRAERAARRRPLRRPREDARAARIARASASRRGSSGWCSRCRTARRSSRRRARSSPRLATTAARRRCACCASCGARACRRRWSSKRAA